MAFFKEYSIFIVLDFSTIICWVVSQAPINPFYEVGPIDAQSGIFFLLLLLPYFLALCSLVYLVYFINVSRKTVSIIGPALLLNLHIFFAIIFLGIKAVCQG
jgi:hypothetical protein